MVESFSGKILCGNEKNLIERVYIVTIKNTTLYIEINSKF
jgi:hypothetical protein